MKKFWIKINNMIRPAEEKDISELVELHLDSFDENHFSVYFSEMMLEKYFSILLSENKFNYVFFDEYTKKIQGYIIAGYSSGIAVNIFIKKNFLSVMKILLKHPKFITEKISKILPQLKGVSNKSKAKCRLYLIATSKETKGKGIGKKLLEHLENELVNNNINEYGLSVRKHNKGAISFYNNAGFVMEYEASNSIFFIKKLILTTLQ